MITKCAGAPCSTSSSAAETSSGQPFWRRTKPAKPTNTRSSGSPSAALPLPFVLAAGVTLLCTIVSGSRIGKRAATSRSIAIAASPQRSMSAPITRLRLSRPSPASAERRCQTTFAP